MQLRAINVGNLFLYFRVTRNGSSTSPLPIIHQSVQPQNTIRGVCVQSFVQLAFGKLGNVTFGRIKFNFFFIYFFLRFQS